MTWTLNFYDTGRAAPSFVDRILHSIHQMGKLSWQAALALFGGCQPVLLGIAFASGYSFLFEEEEDKEK